jgi:predicted ATP-grasp superfamily ATP-dependent carboligase
MSRADGRLDAIALDAAQRASLVCVRSWGRAGLRVGAFDASANTPAAASRWCAVSGTLPPADGDPGELAQSVLELVERHRPRVVVTTHDGTVEALRGMREELERHTRIAIPSEDALRTATSKPLTLALARELGIGIPRSCGIGDVGEVAGAIREVGLPAVLKPTHSWIRETRRRVVSTVVTSQRAAEAAACTFDEAGTDSIAQQWLPGSREGMNLFRADGRVLARFAQVAYRMTPPLGGSSVLRESIRPPADVSDAAERLAHALDLEGYCEIEFRRDADGRPLLMEINPRLSASIEIAVRAGVDFPRLIYNWAANMPLVAQDGYRYGLRVRWLGGDLQWLYWVRHQQGEPDVPRLGRALVSFARDFLKPTAYDYVDLRDPRPVLVATRSLLRKVTSRKAPLG